MKASRRLALVVTFSVAALGPAAPVSANHIVMHSGPFGGVVVGLLPHPAEPDTLYLAAFGSGLYKSVDGGRRWSSISRGLDELTVLSVAMDPVSPRVMYAGTDAGLFSSRDGGETWRRTGASIASRNIRSVVVVPDRPTVLYAATDEGVFWSWDQGASWAARSAGLAMRDVRALRLDPFDPRRIFAAGFGGVFRSDDDGRRWSAANRGLKDVRVRALVADPTRRGTIHAGTAGGGVFVSTDGGGAWEPSNQGLRNHAVLSLLVTPLGERFAGTVGGVYRRSAAAPAWDLVGEEALALTITFVADDPHRPGTIYAGTGGLVFVSQDHGRRWRELALSVSSPVAAAPATAEPPPLAGTHSPKERR